MTEDKITISVFSECYNRRANVCQRRSHDSHIRRSFRLVDENCQFSSSSSSSSWRKSIYFRFKGRRIDKNIGRHGARL